MLERILLRRQRRRGSALLEFTLVGIPILFLSTSVISASLDMWQFHNLAYGTQMTARYVAMPTVQTFALCGFLHGYIICRGS